MLQRCRLLLLASVAVWPCLAFAGDLVMPAGLSPFGQAWFNRYVALDKPSQDQCEADLRRTKNSAAICAHFPPPLIPGNEVAELRAGDLPPLATLPHADALAIARYFAPRDDTGRNAGDALQLVQFAKTGRIPPSPADAQPLVPMGPTPNVVGIIILLAGLGGLVALLGKRRNTHHPTGMASDAHIKQVQEKTGYRAPIQWRGVSLNMLETRSKMPPFVLWYEEGVFNGVPKEHGSPQWRSVVDGNTRLGQAHDGMRVFVQARHPNERRLVTFETTAEEARKLTTGPLRLVTLNVHPDNEMGWHNIQISGGTAGAPMPRAPVPVSDVHGSGGVSSGDADAERA